MKIGQKIEKQDFDLVVKFLRFLPHGYGRVQVNDDPCESARHKESAKEAVAAAREICQMEGLNEVEVFQRMEEKSLSRKARATVASIYFLVHGEAKIAAYYSGGGGFANPKNPDYDPSWPKPGDGEYCSHYSSGDAYVGATGGGISIYPLTKGECGREKRRFNLWNVPEIEKALNSLIGSLI